MVYLKTYYHPDKTKDPVIDLQAFDTDMDALEFVQLSAQSKGLGLNPSSKIHYYEFISKDEYEAQSK